MYVTTRKVKDDAVVEIDVQGVTHRLLIKEADDLVNMLRKAVADASGDRGGIWCSECGKFLGVMQNRPGKRMVNCACGHQQIYTERPWLNSDISVDVSVYFTPQDCYEMWFNPVTYDERSGGHLKVHGKEFREILQQFRRFADTYEASETEWFEMHVSGYRGARNIFVTQKQCNSVFGLMSSRTTFAMTDADLDNIVTKMSKYEWKS